MSDASAPPRFSVVSAVYDVASYLPAFIASIEAQRFPLERLEVIAVDDGSNDGCAAILDEWQRRRPELVRVLHKENGGQASARNLGLEHARGEWVTFPDPDDILDPDYFRQVDAFLAANPTTVMVGTNRLLLDDATGELTDNHPLRQHFAGGSRLRDLNQSDRYFHGSAPAAFVQRELLVSAGIRFDPMVRPNFEDGHFCCRYLLAAPEPLVGFVPKAIYQYRKRRDASSTLQRSLSNPDRYTKVLRNGYLALLEQTAERFGRPPGWLQGYVIYELMYYFSSEPRAATNSDPALADEYHELMARICALLDPEIVASIRFGRLRQEWRDTLRHGFRDENWHSSYAVVTRIDPDQRLFRVAYRFVGEPPAEQFMVEGVPVRPLHAKVRGIPHHGRIVMKERIAWVPFGELALQLDGQSIEILTREPESRRLSVPPLVLRREVEAREVGDPIPGTVRAPREWSARDRVVAWLARTGPVRRRYGQAWVLMDRIHDADDSAEHLFQYLRAQQPQVNAWFVIEGGTPDHRRLRRAGSGRIVVHGSLRWKLLMANCRHLISSHADAPVVRPPAILKFTDPRWRFTFLQHGVIKDDLSPWLNHKNIDLFVTSTVREYESIQGDGTAYAYTSKEAKLTGLPRFDRMLEAGRRYPADRRDLILLAPTWRNWLLPPLEAGTQRRSLAYDDFRTSEFAEKWLSLLNSPELADAAARHGLTVGFLPHPNLQSIIAELALPPHVRAFGWDDARDLFARSRVLVTDYSSVAFNAAYVDRPVVYFQFDRERVLFGEHVGRIGYFDYETQGFGPVTRTVPDAVGAIVAAVEAGPDPAPEYARRIAETFPERDGRCCERVYEEIARSTLVARPPALSPARSGGTPGPRARRSPYWRLRRAAGSAVRRAGRGRRAAVR